MANSAVRVDVEGLVELQRELRKIDAAFPRTLRVANNRVAQIVADAAKTRAESLGGVAAKSAASIRVQSGQREAAVKIGGARYPFALGAEFGSHQYRQFDPWTGNQWTDPEGLSVGYFLHPAIRAEVASGRVRDAYGREIEQLTRAAFPK